MAEARANLSKRPKDKKVVTISSSKKSKTFQQESSQALLALNEGTADRDICTAVTKAFARGKSIFIDGKMTACSIGAFEC
jgi:hypothetical protein